MNAKLRLKQYIKMAAQKLYLPAVYRLNARRDVDSRLVLFADAHHDVCPESMTLLAEEMKRRGFQIEEMYLDYGKASARQTLEHMTQFMKRYAQAGTVVICDNFLPAASCRKKEQTRLIQLWHACGALKKFGYDTTDDIPANYRGNVFAGTDLVTVSAPFCEKPFARAMRLPEDHVRALGVSRTDRFFDEEWLQTCRQRFEEVYREQLYLNQLQDGQPCDEAGLQTVGSITKKNRRRVALWAPTFRGNPGAPECIELDIEKLQRDLGEEYLVIESTHPHMHREKTSQQEALTTLELLPSVDILIADYSSLLFEYCLLGRPMVLYTPDYERYTGRRGFYMRYGDIPGEHVTREEELAAAVRRADAAGMDSGQRKRFLDRYMSACDGQATKRIAAYISGDD